MNENEWKGKALVKPILHVGFFVLEKNSMDKNENHRNSRMHFSTTVFKLSKFTEKKRKKLLYANNKNSKCFYVCLYTYMPISILL